MSGELGDGGGIALPVVVAGEEISIFVEQLQSGIGENPVEAGVGEGRTKVSFVAVSEPSARLS